MGFEIEGEMLERNEVDGPSADLGSTVLETLERKSRTNSVGQFEEATGKWQTHRVMRERSVRCAAWMKSQGLGRRDVVAVCSRNQLDVPLACFATLYLGAVVSPWDDGANADEFRHLLSLMRPKMAFVSEEAAAAFAEAAEEATPDLKIVVFGEAPGFLEFERVISEAAASEAEGFRCTAIESLDEIALIMCSSGTTGPPKGVALSHKAVLKQIDLWKEPAKGNFYMTFSGMCWLTGTILTFVNVFSNETTLVPKIFEEYSACEFIEKYKIKVIHLSPSAINRLVKSDAVKKYDITSLERVIYGGAPLAISSREAFSNLLPNALITSAYGMTEVGGLFSVQSINPKPGSCGRIIENAQLKVVEPNTGETLGANQKGELLLKTLSMMNFYYNNPEATAAAIDHQGWLRSGDLGYYDEDGEIFVLERLKELIKYRGYRISPSEIESVLSSHPGVREVAVVSVPHPVDDEHPVAFVVRASHPNCVDEQVTAKELVDLVADRLDDSKRLRGGVRFVDHLPKTPAGKILRRKLRDLLRSQE